MKLTLLPSEKGDCMLVEGGGVAILADGGMPGSYKDHVRGFLGKWAKAGGKLDLIYVSHVDQDHIAGVLQLLEDMVEWRVHRFKKAKNKPTTEPGFDAPPEAARIWHNSFKALVPENGEAIASMLAARASTLSSAGAPMAALKLAAAYRNIANSIPEAIKVSRRIAADQLAIPLNGEFGGKLAMVRGKKRLKLKPGSTLTIRVIGPFEKDLEILRDYWNAWLQDTKNAGSIEKLKKWLADRDGPLASGGVGLSIDDEIGKRKNVTEPNLASLMLLLEEPKAGGGTTRVVMTGDGHQEDVLAGLAHHGVLKDGKGLHVDLLKVQHHGSEHNMDRDFARRITAEHYVFCANGEHENPDLRILEVLLDSRLGPAGKLSANPEAKRPFTIWLNSSSALLDKEIAAKPSAGEAGGKLAKAREHLVKVEAMLKAAAKKANQASPGRVTLRLMEDETPLVVEV